MMPFYSLLILKAIILYPAGPPTICCREDTTGIISQQTYFSNIIFIFSVFNLLYFLGLLYLGQTQPDSPCWRRIVEQLSKCRDWWDTSLELVSISNQPSPPQPFVLLGKEIVFVSDCRDIYVKILYWTYLLLCFVFSKLWLQSVVLVTRCHLSTLIVWILSCSLYNC